jgi:signal peptidase I
MATSTRPNRSSDMITAQLIWARFVQVWKITTRTLLVISGVVGILIGGVAITSFARGEQMMIITSGSMEPSIPVAAVVYVAPLPSADLRVGDVITFGSAQGAALTTHRIIGIRSIDGAPFYQTQGDANRTPDPNLTPAGAVVGKVTMTLPFIGRVLDFASTLTGRLLLIVFPVLVLTGRQLGQHVRHDPKLQPAHATQP